MGEFEDEPVCSESSEACKRERGAISKGMVEIENNIQGLDVIISQLEKALESILKPETVGGDESVRGAETPRVDSSVAYGLNMYAKNVKGLYTRAHRLLNRIDI